MLETGNWLVASNIFYFPFHIWVVILPNWRTDIFQRGRLNHQPVSILMWVKQCHKPAMTGNGNIWIHMVTIPPISSYENSETSSPLTADFPSGWSRSRGDKWMSSLTNRNSSSGGRFPHSLRWLDILDGNGSKPIVTIYLFSYLYLFTSIYPYLGNQHPAIPAIDIQHPAILGYIPRT